MSNGFFSQKKRVHRGTVQSSYIYVTKSCFSFPDESLPEIIGQSSQSSSTSTTVSPPTTAAVYTPKTVPTISNVNLTNQKDHRPYSLSHASHSSHESSHSSNDKKPASTIGTTKPTPQYVSSTEKPYDSDELLDDEEYEYDDDYYTTNGKELQDYQNQSMIFFIDSCV